ncbi:MmyB family transcriptional regulator [Streptomyces xanthophaeus]
MLAWNRLGHTLFAGHLGRGAPDLPAQRPNMARLVFLDNHTRGTTSVACRAAARNEADPGPAFSGRGAELGR